MANTASNWFGLVGAGGFAREAMPTVRDWFRRNSELGVDDDRIVFVSRDESGGFAGRRVMSEAEFTALGDTALFNVAIGDGGVRRAAFDRLEQAGCRAASIQAFNAMIAEEAEIAPGAVFAPFSTVTSNARIGRGFQANIYSYVAHDCVVGDFVTLAPRASVNGNVVIEDEVYVGTGAVIRQGASDRPLRLGRGCVIGMGAVVTRDVEPGATVVGNPARSMTDR